MFFKSAAAVAGLVGLAQSKGLVALAERGYDGYECPADSGYTSVIISTQVVAYPVIINQFFDHNTFIVINGGVTVNINNAPTTLSTTVTATSTVTVTSTVGPAVQTPVLIQVQGALAKRQTGPSYLGAGGEIVGSCGQAAEFTTDAAGQLFSDGEQVSTDTGASEELVAVSPVIGDITGTFSANGGFSWSNNAFSGGAATFCAKGNLLYAEFTSTIPAGCNSVVLSTVPASDCASVTSGAAMTTTFATLTSSTGMFSNSTTVA